MDPQDIISKINALRIPHQQVADAIGVTRTVATKLLRGTRQPKVHELPAFEELCANYIKINAKTLPAAIEEEAYVAVERLPLYALGRVRADMLEETTSQLVPKVLVENLLRGRPEDFVIVSTRGDSMEPDFFQGDEVIVDKRESDPRIPGVYALQAGDVCYLRNVEVTRDGLRIFTTNPKYAGEYLNPEEVEVIGRPVWVGRLL